MYVCFEPFSVVLSLDVQSRINKNNFYILICFVTSQRRQAKAFDSRGDGETGRRMTSNYRESYSMLSKRSRGNLMSAQRRKKSDACNIVNIHILGCQKHLTKIKPLIIFMRSNSKQLC